jgi:prophage DNA circulation protein
VCELPGSGLLIHPSIGAVQASLLSCSTAISRDEGRVISIQFQFIEDTGPGLLSALIGTGIEILSAADAALGSSNIDLGNAAGPAVIQAGPSAIGEGVAVVTSFCGQIALGGTDPAGIVAMAVGLPPPDADHTYGRYAYGSLTTPLPAGSTVQTLQAQLAAQRSAIATATAAAVAAAQTYSAATDMLDALATIVEAMRGGLTNPADQVRVLLGLAAFVYTDSVSGTPSTIPGDMAAVRDAMAAACRRAAVASLARACAAYQPSSYQDAVNLRMLVTAAIDSEITGAGDAAEDDTYVALKALRAAVIADLTARGASLPSVVTRTFPLPLPALVLAQMLYQDASRSDQIAAETAAPHPAFCPATIQVLAS